MAPEYGATTGYFPVDARHARLPARRPAATPAPSRWSRPTPGASACGSTRPPSRATRARSTIDLVGDRHARRRPAAAAGPAGLRRGARARWPRWTSAPTAARRRCRATRSPSPPSRAAPTPPTRACWSPPGCWRARRARLGPARCRPGSRPRSAPGSPAAAALPAARRPRSTTCRRVGFDIVGYGCTTCIGNSGPAARGDPRRAGSRRHPAGGGAVGQPQLPRPRASRPRPRLPDVAAAGDRVRARPAMPSAT